MSTRVDLHVHSKYSDRPSEWLLRRIGAPESFVEPLEVYRRARAAGMDFVTISDHNCIDGALEIAHLDRTFVSNEVTTYFPEDGCKIHCLVSGISEAQFRMIEELRPSIYDFREYLISENIAYSVAHPFFTVNGRLTPGHVEKLMVLFNCFEGLNGSRDRRASDLVNVVFRNLTPQWLARAAERHGLEPYGKEPWRKSFTGGSDDHSGLYVGSAFTTAPACETREEFLDHLRSGDHELGGEAGSSLRLAHSFYEIGYQYYKTRIGRSPYGRDLLGEVFENLLRPPERSSRSGASVTRSVSRTLRGMVNRMSFRKRYSDTERQILAELGNLLRENSETGELSVLAPEDTDAERAFRMAGKLAHLAGFGLVRKFANHAGEGRLVDALQTLAALGPVTLGIAPYLASFATQHKDEPLLRELASHFAELTPSGGSIHRGERHCWLTDTFNDVNGVARMIQILGLHSWEAGLDLEVITCEERSVPISWLTNFSPVGSFGLPEYDMQRLSFPPFLDILRYLETNGCRELIISTPGPMGLVGLMAAKLLGIRSVGIYHTDFPAYVEAMTDNASLASLARQYMSWFYDQLDLVYAPSRAYREVLLEMGFSKDRVEVLRRGVDVARFSPSKRSNSFWQRFAPSAKLSVGGREPLRLLYVGRISDEKNLDYLVDEFIMVEERLRTTGRTAALYMVGDGPAREALQRRAEGHNVVFTGFLDGEALATAYASSDLFVFPSMTDTFGNVVLEAQASGLPTLVSDRGGPRELIIPERSGVVLDCTIPGSMANAILALDSDRDLLASMARAAEQNASGYSWGKVLQDLWEGPGRRASQAESYADSCREASENEVVASRTGESFEEVWLENSDLAGALG